MRRPLRWVIGLSLYTAAVFLTGGAPAQAFTEFGPFTPFCPTMDGRFISACKFSRPPSASGPERKGKTGETDRRRKRPQASSASQPAPNPGPEKTNTDERSMAHGLGATTSPHQAKASEGTPEKTGPQTGEPEQRDPNIYGLTQGADTGERGERSIFYTGFGSASRKRSSFHAHGNNLGIAYSLSDQVEVSAYFGLQAETTAVVHAFSGSENILRGSIGVEAAVGVKYQISKRTESVFGSAVELVSYVQRSSLGDASVEEAFGFEARFMVERTLLPDRLFGALNFTYRPVAVTERATNITQSHSDFEGLAAVSAAVGNNLFVGAEIQHLTKFNGAFLNRMTGWAMFAGPTLYVSLGKHGYIGMGIYRQIIGRSSEDSSESLDLINFERYRLSVKSGFTF